ncbi:ATP-binding protein [Gallaecimonas sp. GXIMD4217]|uniref:ATP-binding protein n=1 Tax=Gallaecimonas sp. GXIMD4217 TaxID=3131927 RepID=UPI00311ABF7D
MNWLKGFTGRIFLWFWLAISLLLVTNNLVLKHLEEKDRPRALLPEERQLVTKLENALPRLTKMDTGELLLSPEGRQLRLYDPQSLRPITRTRSWSWRLSGLVAEEEIKAMDFRRGRYIGPFQLQLKDGDYLALWRLPPRRLSFWERFLAAPPWIRVSASLVVVLLMSLVLAHWLARPIRELGQVARRLGNGDMSARARAGSGEVGQLAKDFNAMADQVALTLDNQKRLLADVSHELRSPLTRLKLAAAMMEDKPEPRFLERIEKECVTLEELIDKVLTLSRLEATLYDEPVQDSDLAALARAAAADAEFQAQDGQRLELRLPELAGYPIRPRLMQRLLDNLLANALRYGQHIRLSLAPKGGGWLLCVEDDGPGVPEAELAHLFEPFYKGDPARGHGGQTGLGLAIVQAAAKAHGGAISAGRSELGGLKICLQLS